MLRTRDTSPCHTRCGGSGQTSTCEHRVKCCAHEIRHLTTHHMVVAAVRLALWLVFPVSRERHEFGVFGFGFQRKPRLSLTLPGRDENNCDGPEVLLVRALQLDAVTSGLCCSTSLLSSFSFLDLFVTTTLHSQSRLSSLPVCECAFERPLLPTPQPNNTTDLRPFHLFMSITDHSVLHEIRSICLSGSSPASFDDNDDDGI